jgi:hypothetical protein
MFIQHFAGRSFLLGAAPNPDWRGFVFSLPLLVILRQRIQLIVSRCRYFRHYISICILWSLQYEFHLVPCVFSRFVWFYPVSTFLSCSSRHSSEIH